MHSPAFTTSLTGCRGAFHGTALRRVCINVSATPAHRRGTESSSSTLKAVAANSMKKGKLSKVEGIKLQSKQLRFPLDDELANDEIFISENAVQVMKFHGSYQQDDRDMRVPKQPKKYQFMLRLKMPSGEFPAKMYQTLDDLSTAYGNNTLRATTRCAWQMHGVLKGNLKAVFSSIMNSGGGTVGACGDLSRNVMTTPAPFVHKQYAHARFVSKMLGEIFAPQTGAFSEIWLDGEKAATLEYWKDGLDMNEVSRIIRDDNGKGVVFPDKEEPIYGETYLPRKFKIGVTVPGDNSIDIYTQDIGIVVIANNDGDVQGYNLIVGGGMGRTHKKESTFARTGDHLGYVPADKLWDACKAIVAAQRDHGNREVRANARMKYLVHKMGIDSFRKLVETYFGQPFEPFREMRPWKYEDWLGWHQQGDGNMFLGLFVENGRIKDEGSFRLKSGLRRLVDKYGFDLVVTPNQNIILRNIAPNQQYGVESILSEHGVSLVEDYDANHRLSMACPAMPLCGLAVTEAERHMPSVVKRMNKLFSRMDVAVPITMRMTGCPNGCARPYMAEIGFVGSAPLTYQIWLGGCPNQTRLAFPFLDKVKDEDLESVLEPILAFYKKKSLTAKEPFGDFCSRMGKAELSLVYEESRSKNAVPAANTSTTSQPGSKAMDSKADFAAVSGASREPPRVTVIGDGASSNQDTTSGSSSKGDPVARDEQPTELSSPPSATEVQADTVKPKTSEKKRKRKIKPRLTVNADIMERLKNIAALRDMSASQVASEIISAFLSGVEDEDLVEDGGML